MSLKICSNFVRSIDLENFDLAQLPSEEDNYFEFKSSRILESISTPKDLEKKLKDLSKKLSCAVSGFANSGGGYFVVGVDDHGEADGGLPLKIGRNDLRDWVDKVVNQVEPAPRYDIKLIYDPMGRGTIHSGSAVLLVGIYESHVGPHMAPDNHYYIRAGAHTEKARHFIVDAIWAKRHFSKPRLTHLFRLKPGKEEAIQLGILALTDAPAVDVKINVSPLPQMLQHQKSLFPLQTSVIDQNNPFFFDVTIYSEATKHFGDNVFLEVEYRDLAGNLYPYRTKVEVAGSIPPTCIGNDNPAKIVEALKSINNVLLQLTNSRENVAKPSLVLSKPSENIFTDVEKLIPELLAEMREDLLESPFARECILISRSAVYEGDSNIGLTHCTKWTYCESTYLGRFNLLQIPLLGLKWGREE
ncbi:MAG: ATP-binding protein [Phormidesmis sp. CAN_BIN44]|nr:ATP-binding protein [Phormidesmis sp. CAN_BIN44]